MTGGGFAAEPEALRTHGGAIRGHGETVHQALAALHNELDWIGDCWGTDEVGSRFAEAHTGPAADALAAFRAAGDALIDTGDRFTATANAYRDTETGNAAGLAG